MSKLPKPVSGKGFVTSLIGFMLIIIVISVWLHYFPK